MNVRKWEAIGLKVLSGIVWLLAIVILLGVSLITFPAGGGSYGPWALCVTMIVVLRVVAYVEGRLHQAYRTHK